LSLSTLLYTDLTSKPEVKVDAALCQPEELIEEKENLLQLGFGKAADKKEIRVLC
jgi:hypothetical protein